jgi:uroporphyrinogen-III decarboxylase
MTSRERMLAAMRRQPVDRVPIPGLLWSAYDQASDDR